MAAIRAGARQGKHHLLFHPALECSNMFLLCIDLLGMESGSRLGMPRDPTPIWEDFADLVSDTAASLEEANDIRGEIVSDQCVLQCPTLPSALQLGQRIFRRSWLETRNHRELRLWLQGVVTEGGSEPISRMYITRPDEEIASIQRTMPNKIVRRAQSCLRSGFQGMRILVDEKLLDDELRGVFRIPLGRLGLIPFRRMNFTYYPKQLSQDFQDFLWMADEPDGWQEHIQRMKQRMLWSAGNPTEADCAAATQVVFHETDVIYQSINRKNATKRDDQDARPRQRPTTRPPLEASAED